MVLTGPQGVGDGRQLRWARIRLVRREAIVAGASRVFLAHGLEGVSMTRIAAESAVTKVTLYAHFRSKSALFAAVVQHWLDTSLAYSRRLDLPLDEDLHGLLPLVAHSVAHAAGSDVYRALSALVQQPAKLPHAVITSWSTRFQRQHALLAAAFAMRHPDTADAHADQFLALVEHGALRFDGGWNTESVVALFRMAYP